MDERDGEKENPRGSLVGRRRRYDIQAKVAEEDLTLWQSQGPRRELLQQMVRQLLTQRCKLAVHETSVEVDTYALTVDDGHRSKLPVSHDSSGDPLPKGIPQRDGGVMIPFARGQQPRVRFVDASMSALTSLLNLSSPSRPIIDRTGLTGRYDFAVDRLEDMSVDPPPSTIWRIGELGLKLVPTRTTVNATQIEHIERPSEN